MRKTYLEIKRTVLIPASLHASTLDFPSCIAWRTALLRPGVYGVFLLLFFGSFRTTFFVLNSLEDGLNCPALNFPMKQFDFTFF